MCRLVCNIGYGESNRWQTGNVGGVERAYRPIRHTIVAILAHMVDIVGVEIVVGDGEEGVGGGLLVDNPSVAAYETVAYEVAVGGV